jgi:hypothetical protein
VSLDLTARLLPLTVAALAALGGGIAPRPSARPLLPFRWQVPADTAEPARHRLFDSVDPIEFTLTADLRAVAKDRGTEKHLHRGVLSYRSATGDTVSVNVQLRTRGHYRLRTCEFPPLKLDFDRTDAGHTLFAHEGSLKLVVQCRGSRAYANYLLEEYLIYRVYNLLTAQSFRARLARVTYVDTSAKSAPATRYAFFLEDDDRMARRNHMQVFAQKGVHQEETDFEQMGLVTLFQYLIGNTDWSVAALHNIVLIRDSVGIVFPVPYDFDWSGVISTPYAQPDPRLGIRTVRERTYRGTCRTSDDFAPLFAQFNVVKDSIYALYRGQPDLEPKRVEQALGYYDEFYRTINEPRRAKHQLIDSCPAARP